MIPWVYIILPESKFQNAGRSDGTDRTVAKGIPLEDMDNLFGYCPHGGNMAIEDGVGKNEIEEREVVNIDGLS